MGRKTGLDGADLDQKGQFNTAQELREKDVSTDGSDETYNSPAWAKAYERMQNEAALKADNN